MEIATLIIGVVVWWAAAVAPAASGSSVSVVVNGQVAWKSFPRFEGDAWSIDAANPNGSHVRRLTHPGAGVHDDLPDWSPDGSSILFVRIFQPSSNSATVADEIMRVKANGSDLRRIGSCTGRCIGNDDPQYSPDGRQIVYTRAVRLQHGGAVALGVWVMDSDGRNSRQLTQLATPPTSEDHEPAWSPDGQSIVFTRLNDTAAPRNQQALFVVPRKGGTPRRITSWALDAGGANWSPDGSEILFQSYRDCSCTQTSQVYTVASDGSRVTRLTSDGRNIEPNWSPDGKKIIYAHQPGVGANQLPDLWTMSANGERKRPFVQTRRWESEPDWGTAPPVP